MNLLNGERKDIDYLKTEIDHLKNELDEMTRLRDYAEKSWATQRVALMNQIDSLKEYVRHGPVCMKISLCPDDPTECTCGLDELLTPCPKPQ